MDQNKSNETQPQSEQTPHKVTHCELLERGIATFRKVLNQPVTVTREEMCDLLNFEVTVNYELSANAPEYYKCHMIAFKEIDVELKPSESGVMVSVK